MLFSHMHDAEPVAHKLPGVLRQKRATIGVRKKTQQRVSDGEQGEAVGLLSTLLGAIRDDRLKRQPEMLEPPTEIAAAEAKASETVETEAVSARWLSWAETRSELRVVWGLDRQENVGSPPSTPMAADGGNRGSSLRRPRPSDRPHSCQPKPPATTSPTAKRSFADATTWPTLAPSIVPPMAVGAA